MSPSSLRKTRFGSVSAPQHSLVIPAYNEARRIGDTIRGIFDYIERLADTVQIIVVSDGSTDDTVDVVKGAMAHLPSNAELVVVEYSPNRGKGAAVKVGCLEASGGDVLFSDADLATPIEEAPKLWDALAQGNDMAIGTRVQPDGRDMRASQPIYRQLLGRLYFRFLSLLVVRGIQDSQCGFKAFTSDAAVRLFNAQQIQGVVFDTELLYLAQRDGLRIAQVPVTWTNVGGSRMRVTPGHALRVLLDLLSIRLRHAGGRKPYVRTSNR